MGNKVTIRRYTPQDAPQLFSLLQREGDEWQDYWRGAGWQKYQKALRGSIAYLLFAGEELCGYVRCRDDDGFGVYVYDLLVDANHRGHAYGRLLMEAVCKNFPGDDVYVMSDVNPYYEKLGYEVEGTVFVVKPQA